MALPSEEVVAILAPIIVYWVAAGVYTVLGRVLADHRLHSREEEEVRNLVPKRVVVRTVLLQHVLQAAIAFAVFNVKREDRRAADAGTGAATPAVAVVCCQFMVAMVVLDAWQYGWHRLMHSSGLLYRHVHSWHHRLVAPYAYGAQYNHPLEGLILDTAGGALALAVTGMAPLTAAAFFSFATLKAVDDHSGVLVPGNPLHLLFRNNTAYHDVHHQVRGGRCNYAQLFFVAWDKLMGTYVPYEVVRAPHGGLEAVPLKKKLKT
ncbi:sphinganine C4-monooxygenase 1-like [Triticum dicoccoides]|nr:sphinganine C4-monooxygenase 1-like [Triticum dicoccoides]XP_044406159.1 sphinganine C4-monooxygenase 1-like [Triticum aestivum]